MTMIISAKIFLALMSPHEFISETLDWLEN